MRTQKQLGEGIRVREFSDPCDRDLQLTNVKKPGNEAISKSAKERYQPKQTMSGTSLEQKKELGTVNYIFKNLVECIQFV